MDRATRQHILHVALRHFADRGYAGTSVQHIVDEAKVAKPMLYYYFQSKAGLYQALIDNAHDERFRIVSQAAEEGRELREKLTAILLALFGFIQKHREVVRLAFASAFAAPGEMPEQLCYKEKCQRNFEFFHDVVWIDERLRNGPGIAARDFLFRKNCPKCGGFVFQWRRRQEEEKGAGALETIVV